MTTTRRLSGWRRAAQLGFPIIAAIATFIACGSDRPDAAGDGINSGGGPFCGTPNAGCDCSTPGEVVDCGSVETKSGDYVACSIGKRTCLGGKWGECQGTSIVTKNIATAVAGDLRGLTLGGSTMCPPPPSTQSNPCDPYCNQFVDDPTGLVIGGGITVTPGGITIGGAGSPVACQQPMDWTAVYAQYSAGSRPNGAPPTTCAVGSPDKCSLDTKCVGTTCTPNAVAANGACVGKDFTLGTPCWDGTRFTFQVCNRGTVAATSGILPIAHHTGSPSVAPSTCTMAVNGPAGDCSIDLALKPLQPGTCVEFTPTADCPLSVPTEAGDNFYFVNQSNTGIPLIAGECNTCNNYTATKDTAKPPGVPGAACTAISCGGLGSAGGQPATQTTPTGINTCAGSLDAVINPCTAANANKNCQQDFHCDLTAGSPTINTCVWNAGTAYVDPTCNGVDLTIGSGCDNGPGYTLPVCNRGTKSLPAGSVLKLGQTNSGGYSTWNANCTVGTPVTCSQTLTAPLGPGQCTNVTTCPGGTGQRWEIVNADNSIAECGAPGAGCANNVSQVKDDGSGCANCVCKSGTAELTGKILDPAKRRAVYGAAVYVPTTAVGALSGPNVKCDTCQNIYGGLPAAASATTDVDGTFRLQGVPAGVSFPLVIQLGRFRRQVTVAAIPACGTAVLPAAQAHLPATKAKAVAYDTMTDTANPDMPLIAMVTGAGDATECLLARMGIAVSEFTAPGGGGAVEMYEYKQSNGLTGGASTGWGGRGATFPGSGAADALFGTAAAINKYNALILPCHNTAAGSAPTPAMQANLAAWLDAGGRLFSSHIPVEDFIHKPAGNANDGVATWSQADQWGSNQPDSSDRSSSNALTDDINVGFPKGVGMATWLQQSWAAPAGPGGAAPALGKLPLPDYRHDVAAVSVNTTSWISGKSTGPANGAGVTQHNILSFDTPRANPAASQCGRAVLPFMHVSSASTGSFPSECGTVPNFLSGQELAFEFMMWEAMTCLAPSTVPPVSPPVAPIPPPVPLATVTFTRDYQAVCPTGTKAEWEFFYWQSVIPSGTNISFRAATSATPFAAPPPVSTPPPAAPASVPIAQATTSTPVLPVGTWSQDAQTVADHLRLEPPGPAQTSLSYLRVYMTFNPSGGAAPVLQSWRQTYDCKPVE